MDEIQTPNLDCLEIDELRQVEITFARLAAYAGHKKDAMAMRLKGDIEAALASEKAADNQYQQLPAPVRW